MEIKGPKPRNEKFFYNFYPKSVGKIKQCIYMQAVARHLIRLHFGVSLISKKNHLMKYYKSIIASLFGVQSRGL